MRLTGLICVALLWASQVCWAEPFGKVTSAIGNASVFSQKRKAWRSARLQHKVQLHDTVKTSADSRLEITCKDGGIVRIDEKSEIVLTKNAKTGNPQVALLGGKLWANMKKIVTKRKRFDVATPTATAAIRGTVFRVDSKPDSSTDVLVYEGKVDVGPSAALTATLEKTAKLGKRKQAQKPKQVAGPRQVSLQTWVALVAGQRISVWNNGNYQKSRFDQAQDARESWVKYNQERDNLPQGQAPKKATKPAESKKGIDWEKGWE